MVAHNVNQSEAVSTGPTCNPPGGGSWRWNNAAGWISVEPVVEVAPDVTIVESPVVVAE